MRAPGTGTGAATRRPGRAALALCLVAAGCLGWTGCTRGSTSERPPIHLNPNMDDQPRAEAQEASAFFADGAAMRRPVEGTVARGAVLGGEGENRALAVDQGVLTRGAERYAIYCAPCHGPTGDGQSMLRERAGVNTADLLQARLRQATDGALFDVVTDGLGLMPGYAYQIPVEDRWAIVAHVRELQSAAGPVAEETAAPEDPSPAEGAP